MKQVAAFILSALFAVPLAFAQGSPLTRSAGLALIWEGIHRPVDDAAGMPFADVGKDRADYALITFAEERGIVNEAERFEPESPLNLSDALLWLLRTRNIADWKTIRYDTIGNLAAQKGIIPANLSLPDNPAITREDLEAMIATLDAALKTELHVVSYYGEDFRGEHTAFGEIFNPDELTAAHRTFPQGTMVRVANTADGRSVVVRINDRGPYVTGRDMDLSRAAFERISDLSHGVIGGVTFERLGHESSLIAVAETTSSPSFCGTVPPIRTVGTLQITPGIPRKAKKGTTMTLEGNQAFRIIILRTPQGNPRDRITIRRGTSWDFRFTEKGNYLFIVMGGGKRMRAMVRVAEGC